MLDVVYVFVFSCFILVVGVGVLYLVVAFWLFCWVIGSVSWFIVLVIVGSVLITDW